MKPTQSLREQTIKAINNYLNDIGCGSEGHAIEHLVTMETNNKEMEERQQLQHKVEESIKEFITKKNSANTLGLATFYLFGGRPSLWSDNLYEMKVHLKALLQVFIDDNDAMAAFRSACHPHHNETLGRTLTNLAQFLSDIDSSATAKAEIDLASMEEFLLEDKVLKAFPIPYKR